MRNDRFNRRRYNCKCVNYGQIDPKKIEALRKIREKEMCTWKELSLFRDNEIKDEPRMGHQTTGKPMFPPISRNAASICSSTNCCDKNEPEKMRESSEVHRKRKLFDSLPPL